jgi:hypothetical protein
VSSYRTERKDAQRAERTVPICLRGDLVGDWEAADRELKRVQQENLVSNSIETPDLAGLAERVRALEAEMHEHTENYRLRAMPRHKFRALVAAHPPRIGEDGEVVEDDRLGLNSDTFFPELIRQSVVEPKLDDEDWAWLLGTDDEDDEGGILTDRQVGDLQDVAWFLNRGEVNVPFSHAASLANRGTGSESN